MKNKTNQDLWDMMSPDEEQLLAEALAKTDEEVAESLRAKGYDLDVLDQQLIGLINRLPTYQERKPRRGYVGRIAAATLASGGSVYAYFAATAAPVLTAVMTAAAPAPPAPAEALRQDAIHECAFARWTECLDDLDKARDLDPVGDDARDVTEVRRMAEAALGRKPDGGAR